MREAVGSSFVFNLIIIFVGVILFTLIGSFSYSKAFKIKNNIVNIVDRHNGYTADARAEIDGLLRSIGYRVLSNSSNPSCDRCDGRTDCVVETPSDVSLYRYCIYKYETNKTVYYGIESYMYFDFPLIGGYLEFPVYGETKSLYIDRN